MHDDLDAFSCWDEDSKDYNRRRISLVLLNYIYRNLQIKRMLKLFIQSLDIIIMRTATKNRMQICFLLDGASNTSKDKK